VTSGDVPREISQQASRCSPLKTGLRSCIDAVARSINLRHPLPSVLASAALTSPRNAIPLAGAILSRSLAYQRATLNGASADLGAIGSLAKKPGEERSSDSSG
jgi:hypothetical protein